MSPIQGVLLAMLVLAGFLFLYHHFLFPLYLSAKARTAPQYDLRPPRLEDLPSITVVIPAYNEATMIAGKLRNIARWDYPQDKVKVLLACDGCQDDTAAIAHQVWQEASCRSLDLEVQEFPQNRGKMAVLNDILPELTSDLVCLTDVSAWVSPSCLKRAAAHFQSPDLAVLSGTYRLAKANSAGEEAYWRYQIRNKLGEAALGSPMGAHGAFYVMRTSAVTALPSDTINDDFILPMTAVLSGHQARYDSQILSVEQEESSQGMDFQRRCRIAAGNAQQVMRLKGLLHPRFNGVALAFFSGKALRVLMPYLMIFGLLGTLALAPLSPFFLLLFGLQLMGYGLVVLRHTLLKNLKLRSLDLLTYLVTGHAASLLGSLRYFTGLQQTRWSKVSPSYSSHSDAKETLSMVELDFTSPLVANTKRALDLTAAMIGLLLLSPIMAVIVLFLKLDSKGPVIYSQQRIGRCCRDHTQIFWMYKFRTMTADAEKSSGAVWASQNDQRITRVGRFLRKSRLDEIPQLWNVLVGDMSLIGPRPERPGFYQKLERSIPYFAERTVGLRPGITGLAQVNQGYDRNLDDVRRKVGFDHAYALSLGTFSSWITSDLHIATRTLWVMVAGRGQ